MSSCVLSRIGTSQMTFRQGSTGVWRSSLEHSMDLRLTYGVWPAWYGVWPVWCGCGLHGVGVACMV